MWLFLALLAGGLYTLQGLLTRATLKGNQDAWAFSFYFSAVGALTALPFMVTRPQLSSQPIHWVLLGLVCVLIVIQNYLNFRATNILEASIQGSVTKFRLLWILIIGVIWLGESLTLWKVLGTLLTIAAGVVIYFRSTKIDSRQGVLLTLAATVLYAVVIGLYKFLFAGFGSDTLTFFIFAIPAAINLVGMPNALQRVTTMAQQQGRIVLLATFFGGLANLAMNRALSVGEASRVLVIIEAFLIVLLLGEHLYLKESGDLKRKVVAVALATIGAVLIRLSN